MKTQERAKIRVRMRTIVPTSGSSQMVGRYCDTPLVRSGIRPTRRAGYEGRLTAKAWPWVDMASQWLSKGSCQPVPFSMPVFVTWRGVPQSNDNQSGDASVTKVVRKGRMVVDTRAFNDMNLDGKCPMKLPNFEHWEFPHGNVPTLWEAVSSSEADNHVRNSACVFDTQLLDEPCHLTGTRSSLKMEAWQ